MLGWKRRNSLLLVLWLVFFVAYMDRINFSIAVPFITKELGLMPTQVGAIMSAFFVGYGLCQIFGGILADKFGPRKTMTLALCWWSVFTIFTGMTGGFLSLLVVRALFGMLPILSSKFKMKNFYILSDISKISCTLPIIPVSRRTFMPLWCTAL